MGPTRTFNTPAAVDDDDDDDELHREHGQT
jgi:hypothetical protein